MFFRHGREVGPDVEDVYYSVLAVVAGSWLGSFQWIVGAGGIYSFDTDVD